MTRTTDHRINAQESYHSAILALKVSMSVSQVMTRPMGSRTMVVNCFLVLCTELSFCDDISLICFFQRIHLGWAGMVSGYSKLIEAHNERRIQGWTPYFNALFEERQDELCNQAHENSPLLDGNCISRPIIHP